MDALKLSPPEAARWRSPSWTHARSYVGRSPAAFVHRARLTHLTHLVRQVRLPEDALVADLGCSDGYVLSELHSRALRGRHVRTAGYDHAEPLLAAARQRRIPGAEFHWLELNDASSRVPQPADLVICTETLEHVGDYRSALSVLHHAIRPGGLLILSMPNEVGLVGVGKLIGRPLLRQRPYRDFFRGGPDWRQYALSVATRRDLEQYRFRPCHGYASHLGFDHRAVLRAIRRDYVDRGLWTLERVEWSAVRASQFLVVRRST